MSTERVVRLCRGVLGVAAATLLVTVVASRRALTFDERAYVLRPVALLDEHGLSERFLLDLRNPAGLGFNLLHWALEPVTRLTPLGIRLVNVVLAALLFFVLRDLLARRGHERPAMIAACGLAVPYVWTIIGIGEAEMFGMLFTTVGLSVFVRAMEPNRSGGERTLLVGAAATLFAVGFYGRPTLLVVPAICAMSLFLGRPRPFRDIVVLTAVVFGLVLPVVFVWRGLVPPKVHWYSPHGVSAPHAILGLGYGAIGVAILCPKYYDMTRAELAATFTAGFTLNALFAVVLYQPLRTAFLFVFPSSFAAPYAIVAGSVLAGLAAAYTVATIRWCRAHRDDVAALVFAVGAFALMAAAAKITHQYSSRYTAVATPLLVLTTASRVEWTRGQVVRLALGCMLGAVSLGSNLWR